MVVVSPRRFGRRPFASAASLLPAELTKLDTSVTSGWQGRDGASQGQDGGERGQHFVCVGIMREPRTEREREGEVSLERARSGTAEQQTQVPFSAVRLGW